MYFKINGLEKINKLNLKLEKEGFKLDMKQIDEYEKYLSSNWLNLMLNAYKS